ncbi:unnamed protein product [Oncorhynchus mykiss]|uniref:Peptidase C2 calpain domain-containing protein n=1 Tax=Oncorhynchus mykiss TaxID=8022 RepID=A0A060XNF8_ONCMY|nr:unnamed protein product [Oncorhynchus mykiss]
MKSLRSCYLKSHKNNMFGLRRREETLRVVECVVIDVSLQQVYSGCKFSFSKIPTPFTHTKRINGQWKGPSAGGCGNYKDSYKHNPIYQFNLERPGPVLIELRGSRQYSVGFEMVTVSTVVEPGPAGHPKKNSGDYRCGFCYMEADHVPAGIYNVIPTTFLPKQEGPFFLDFSSATPLKVSQLQ